MLDHKQSHLAWSDFMIHGGNRPLLVAEIKKQKRTKSSNGPFLPFFLVTPNPRFQTPCVSDGRSSSPTEVVDTLGKQQEFITSGAVTTSDTLDAGVEGEVEVAEGGREDARTDGRKECKFIAECWKYGRKRARKQAQPDAATRLPRRAAQRVEAVASCVRGNPSS